MKQSDWSAAYARNEYSQYGEDGILEKILEIIPGASWCVEFGAWNGLHLSNTAYLLQKKNWSGVFIEGSATRYQELCRNYADKPKVHCINAWVHFDGDQRLDRILAKSPVPRDFDVLSIDIDGNDYHIWDSLQEYRPKIVIIECNVTIPNHIDFVQVRDFAVHQSSSPAAMVRLGKSKGYELAAVTGFNAIFVEKTRFPLLEIMDNRLETLNAKQPYVTHLYQLFDGTICLEGNKTLLWHDIPFQDDDLQLIPRAIRAFPPSETKPLKWLLAKVWVMARRFRFGMGFLLVALGWLLGRASGTRRGGDT